MAEEQEEAKSAGVATAEPTAVPYDFRSPSRIPKEQTSTVRLVHETFAQTGAIGIGTYLNTEFSLQLEQLEQITFQEYILGLSNPTCTCTFDMQPLSGFGILEVNAPLVYSMIDRMLGGDGEIPTIGRSFTELELAIIRKLMQIFLKELRFAWGYVLNLNFGLRDIQTNPSFVR
ncbi:MAG: hypothetical protein KDK78_12330, partial [Chlamydiia bacterium]|nr:hypothetical protein [Chlamydiia bacterium]